MYEYLPLLILGSIIGVFSVFFILAYALMKNKKEAIGFDRHMKDGEIIRRLLGYAKPHAKSFIVIGVIMLFSIAYDIISPIIMGDVVQLLVEKFEMKELYRYVIVYAAILIVSLVCTYFQSLLLPFLYSV